MESNYPDPPRQMSESHHVYGRTSGDREYSDVGPRPVVETQNAENPHLEIKKPRACEPCRQLKVRCDPDADHPSGSCKRCAKSGRTCVVTAPSRKRQKKTDTRVTELERKIDALTATLQASHRVALEKDGSPVRPADSSTVQQSSSRRWLRDDLNPPAPKRGHDEMLASQYPRQDSPSAEQLPRSQPPTRWLRVSSVDETPSAKSDNEFADVIDRGLVDVETAHATFDRYVTKCATELPFVVFPPGTTMGYVRREKPILFLAILATTIGPFKKEVQAKLLDDIYRLIAERVIVKGEKSLELVQALLVTAIWYQPPDNMEELKFYQLVQFAVIIAMDLGLNWRTGTEDRGMKRLKEVLTRKPKGSSTDTNGPEAKRTWAGCYFLSVQTSTTLRRTQIVRWNPYMDECMRTLESHPDALASDKELVWWARLGRIMEEASTQLILDDAQSNLSFADSKYRYLVRGFAHQLSQWRREVPEDAYTVPLAHTHHVLNLFIHESAMNVDTKDEYVRLSSDSPISASFPAPLIDAIGTCIHSIHKAVEIICSMDLEKMNCLPTVCLARTTFVVVSLIKVYSLIVAPNSRLGQFIELSSLQIEYYFEKVITHYRGAAMRDGGRAAGKFSYIIMMLRNWFLKKRGNGPALREIFGSETNSNAAEQAAKMAQQSATPLHLLSEVAMGNSVSSASFNAKPAADAQENISYSPSTCGHTSTQAPISTQHTSTKAFGSPDATSVMTGTPSQVSSTTTTTWNSVPSLQPPVSVNSGYYSPFINNDPAQSYNGISASDRSSQLQGMGGISGMNLPTTQDPLNTDPHMNMDAGFDSFSLYMLGNMVDEGLFPFPLNFYGEFQG
ncbi:hypothetical protein N7539_007009 [Penicillium diatomitis]|uniref:Zn(2)-C6 fungal-type domain-containing protein n=1 Tax=Penicillium diatomitis TaxID=2819901 RepID=A0A9X0BSG7_9EURO|nr:uncharacterized protein N7539_007009 [Penicillium diatomitis]KAJ5481115.1 hypothetical protein N7539_007009 [Penicillium diatomitis]